MAHWQVYVKDKICYAFEDGRPIEMFSVGKKVGKELTLYFRDPSVAKTDLTQEDIVAIEESLDSMTCVADFHGPFLYDRKMDMHFDGLARKVDEAGGISLVKTLSEEDEERNKLVAESYIEEARTYANIGPAFFDQARRLAKEGLKYDPQNQDLKQILERME